MARVGLYRVIVPVPDIEAAAGFYARLLDSPGKRVSPGRHYFDCGGTILACYDPEADGDGSGEGWRHHFNQYLYFSVDDVDAMLQRVLDCGGVVEGPVESMPWGERMFYARDPFGTPISFVDAATVFRGDGAEGGEGEG